MGPPEMLNLRWNSFETNTRTVFMELREEREFHDVTVVADCGKQVEANKVVLAGGSTFFHKILKENPHPHPLIYLKGVAHEHLSSVLDFVYTGEADISKDDLIEFLDIAHDLKVKGLTRDSTMEKTTHTSKQTKSSSTSPVPLQGQEKDKEPCLSPVVSHPHCVVTDTSASHKAQIGAEEAGLSARTSHPHSPGEAGPSNTMSRPHCLKSVPLKSQVFIEEVASPSRMSRPLTPHEKVAPSPRISRPPTPHEKVSPSTRMPRLRSVKSAPSQGPEVADEATPSPGTSHPHTVTSSREDHHEASPSPGMSHPHTVTSSHHYNVLSQSTCKDHHDNSCHVKVEVGDAEHYNVAYGNNDNDEDGFQDKEKYTDRYRSAEETQNDHVVNTENKPKEEEMDSCNGVVITEAAIGVFKNQHSAPDWYEVGEKNTETFVKLNNLKKRKRIHAGKMPYQCSGKKKYQCPVCPKICSRPSHLKMHIMSHTGEKPYQCLHCNKSFSLASNMKIHEKIHSGEKPYQCVRCFKRFVQLVQLNQHMKRKNKCSMNL